MMRACSHNRVVLRTEEIAPRQPLPIDRRTYHQLGELGAFQGRRVQLVYGTIIDMSPMGVPHRDALRILNRYLVNLTPPRLDVMVQLPVVVADDSEPEPDFCLVPHGRAEEVLHPVLVIEVADSSANLDLGPKARLYAEAKIPEYWVIELGSRATVVHRTPRRGRYTSVKRVPWSRSLTSSAVPELTVNLANVLPR